MVYPETGFRRQSTRYSTFLDRSGTVSHWTEDQVTAGLTRRQAIFEEFEEESSDEEESDEDEDEDRHDHQLMTKTKGIELDDEEEEGTGVLTSQLRHFVIQVYLPFLPHFTI